MSNELIEEKHEKSLSYDIDNFDKKSLASSVSLNHQEKKITEQQISNKSDCKEIEKETNLNDLSSNSNISNEESNQKYNLINLGSSSYDTNQENKESNQKNEIQNITPFEEENTNYLHNLDKFDKEFSKKIHDSTLPNTLEYIVYLFARIFNPDFITSYFVVILSYKTYHNEPLFVLKPLISTLISLVISSILKKYFERPRPEPSKISKRIFDLRKHEKNFSMPSGDSIQAGNWAMIIYFYTGNDLGFIFVPFVMYARIYFYCHYLFDTIIGALLGSFISFIINIIIYYTI